MSTITKPAASRRRLLAAGAGSLGAIAAAAVIAPAVKESTAPETPASAGAPDPQGGYQVTEHVLRYYDTARV